MVKFLPRNIFLLVGWRRNEGSETRPGAYSISHYCSGSGNYEDIKIDLELRKHSIIVRYYLYRILPFLIDIKMHNLPQFLTSLQSGCIIQTTRCHCQMVAAFQRS